MGLSDFFAEFLYHITMRCLSRSPPVKKGSLTIGGLSQASRGSRQSLTENSKGVNMAEIRLYKAKRACEEINDCLEQAQRDQKEG